MKYKIYIVNQNELKKINQMENDPRFLAGLYNYETKKIYIDESQCKSKREFNDVLRHEIMHGIFTESGLSSQCHFADSEECVDFLALQFPKIYKIFDDLGILD